MRWEWGRISLPGPREGKFWPRQADWGGIGLFRRSPAEEFLQTSVAQPAIFLVEWAGFLVAKERKEPEAVAGHSLGEFAALAAAGVLDWPLAFKLVLARGKLMEEAAQTHPGGMLAVLGLSLSEVESLARESGCFMANINAPEQVVLAGEVSALSRAEKLAKEMGGKALRLGVAGAFHSPLHGQSRSGLRPSPRRPSLSTTKDNVCV
jgi:[acyl-carrier-protein] S-malonyltransferase